MMRRASERAAIGVTVKSGWAAVVLLGGSRPVPLVIDSRRIELSDPGIPDSRQPYHDGYATARREGPVLSRLLHVVRTFGRRTLTDAIRHYDAHGRTIAGVGIVVGSLIDPERIANEHIRIHAREGQLFRGVVEDATRASGLGCSIWRERDLYTAAADALKRSESDVRGAVSRFGREVTGSWRAEQKAAAVAGWLVLARSLRPARSRRSARRQSAGRPLRNV